MSNTTLAALLLLAALIMLIWSGIFFYKNHVLRADYRVLSETQCLLAGVLLVLSFALPYILSYMHVAEIYKTIMEGSIIIGDALIIGSVSGQTIAEIRSRAE